MHFTPSFFYEKIIMQNFDKLKQLRKEYQQK